MRRILALACAGLLLAACATGPGANPRIATGRVIAEGWAGLDGAALAADAAVKAGLLKGQPAGEVATDLRLASASLGAATEAYQANPNADVTTQIVAATAAVAAVLSTVSQAKGTPQ